MARGNFVSPRRFPSHFKTTIQARHSHWHATFILLLTTTSLLALGLWALCLGRVPLTLPQIASVFSGEAPAFLARVVIEWRLPRIVAAVLCGSALGIAGLLFQSLMRNPLGSPDVMGFDTGAWSGVLIAMMLCHATPMGITVGAITGGALTAAAIMLLTWQRYRPLSPLVLIVVGIGVRALLIAFNSWMIMQASLDAALSAGVWGAGSLAGISGQAMGIPSAMIAFGVFIIIILMPGLRMLEMGDDTARGLGVAVGRTRLLLIVMGVVLVAASTALAGPIAFVALVAPQVMRRLSPAPSLRLPLAALGGALLLLAADMVAQHLFLPYQLPVGVVTASLGGLYLLGLLLREVRSS